MTLRNYARVFAHRWVLIALVTVATAAATWFLTPTQSVSTVAQSHTATATLIADSRQADTGGLTLGRISLFIRTGEVPQRVADQIGYAGEPALLGQRITVTTDPESGSLGISSTERSPEQATLVANTFADEAVAFFDEGGPQTADTRLIIQQGAVAVANGGGVGSIIPPGRVPRTALAALLGLLLGMGLALVIERFDSRMRDRREIQAALGMPIIAEIHKLRGKERQHASSIVSTSPRSAPADGYRAARTAVAHSLTASEPGTSSRATPIILVTSANPGEGKTTSVANLALSFAESGKSVLVLDADFHSPDLHGAFDVPQGVGISDYIHDPGAWALESLARPTNAHGVRIITAGTRVEHPATLASRTGVLLEASRGLADVVLVDSAPVLAASDMFDIIPLVDIVVVVARSGRLTENDATRVSELLGRFHVRLAGAITIGSKTPRSRRYGYGYGDYPAGRKRSSTRRTAREDRPGHDERDEVVQVEDLFDDDSVSAGTTRRARREARGQDFDN